MEVHTTYNLGQIIGIKGMDGYPGRINQIVISNASKTTLYTVRYWWEGEMREVMLEESEMERIEQ